MRQDDHSIGSGLSQKAIVKVRPELGLHARPAAKLTKVAQQFFADIFLETREGTANAKSILEVLSLAAAQGTHITISCSGKDAEEALSAVCTLFSTMPIKEHF